LIIKLRFCHILGAIFVRNTSSMIKYSLIIWVDNILLATYALNCTKTFTIVVIPVWRIILLGRITYALMSSASLNAMFHLEQKTSWRLMLTLSISLETAKYLQTLFLDLLAMIRTKMTIRIVNTERKVNKNLERRTKSRTQRELTLVSISPKSIIWSMRNSRNLLIPKLAMIKRVEVVPIREEAEVAEVTTIVRNSIQLRQM